MPSYKAKYFKCNCGDPGHFLHFHEVFEGDMLEVYVTYRSNSYLPILRRLKNIWYAILDKEQEVTNDILLDKPMMVELRDHLNAILEK